MKNVLLIVLLFATFIVIFSDENSTKQATGQKINVQPVDTSIDFFKDSLIHIFSGNDNRLLQRFAQSEKNKNMFRQHPMKTFDFDTLTNKDVVESIKASRFSPAQ